ncbi:procollagen-proline 4-dioxygenase [Aureococcus anophagefferens]|nr:procollagen-proline 4-dioxygenase [Aureococcus anophagefferens]
MVMKCSRSCESCHLRDPELRCPRSRLNVRQVPGLLPGGVDALYENRAAWPQFNVTIHSRPGGDPDGDDFSRSTDQGAVDKYGEQQKVVSTSRTSENAWCTGACESNRATRAVMARIEEVTGVPEENYESFQVLRYTHGQQYRAHHDMSRGDNALACGPRIYTFFMYFSDVEKGGDGVPHGQAAVGKTVKIAPKRGSALLWPSVTSDDPTAQDPRTRHAALPVVEGTKFAANAWIHMFDYNEPNIGAARAPSTRGA